MNETRHTTVAELALHRFRVTDMATHGVVFEASSMASFVHEAALWESAKNTSNSANHMVKHTSGLTQFLNAPPDVKRQPLTIVR
ncbi:hypothetical protein KO116_P200175 (plasmid) [Halomonas sp. KO116]|nr:hypothetical protein KO116_P200175 [Halomonas sp. KO116]